MFRKISVSVSVLFAKAKRLFYSKNIFISKTMFFDKFLANFSSIFDFQSKFFQTIIRLFIFWIEKVAKFWLSWKALLQTAWNCQAICSAIKIRLFYTTIVLRLVFRINLLILIAKNANLRFLFLQQFFE